MAAIVVAALLDKQNRRHFVVIHLLAWPSRRKFSIFGTLDRLFQIAGPECVPTAARRTEGGRFMIVGVPRETYPGERRVALVPTVIPNLAKAGLEVIVEAGAGVEAGFPDAEYAAKGAKIFADRAEVVRPRRTSWSRCFAMARMIRRAKPISAFASRPGSDRISAPSGISEDDSGNRGDRRDFFFGGTDAQDDARAKHGRAFLHGHDLRL